MRLIVSAFVFVSLAPIAQGQHDGARDSVRLIANGKFERVSETLHA